MNLRNFEADIEYIILMRGLDYYTSGNIIELEKKANHWVAGVAGSYDYTVAIRMDENYDINSTFCDCPYDQGDHCKHQVAVLYAIRDRLNTEGMSDNQLSSNDLKSSLSKLDKQELLSILLELAEKNSTTKQELQLRYSQNIDKLKHARALIEDSVESVTRRGYIEYDKLYRATNGVYSVLEMIDNLIAIKDYTTAVSLAMLILDKMIELLNMCDDLSDDSSNDIDEAIRNAIEKINDVTLSLGSNGRETKAIFDMIYDHALHPRYDGWIDWRIDILRTCVPLCGDIACREKLETYIKPHATPVQLGQLQVYETEYWQQLHYDIIQQYDGNAAGTEYINQHLDNDNFRHIAIQNAIKDKDYKTALQLCLEAEEQTSQYSRHRTDWRSLRFHIYELTHDIPAQKTLAKEFVTNGDFDYYLKLKALYNPYQWQPVVNDLLETFKREDKLYACSKVLVNENMKEELLDYCKNNPYFITDYYIHLLPKYKREVGLIFAQLIRDKATRATDRSDYRGICRLILLYREACGEVALEIKNELLTQYPRRPAFRDELRQAGLVCP